MQVKRIIGKSLDKVDHYRWATRDNLLSPDAKQILTEVDSANPVNHNATLARTPLNIQNSGKRAELEQAQQTSRDRRPQDRILGLHHELQSVTVNTSPESE